MSDVTHAGAPYVVIQRPCANTDSGVPATTAPTARSRCRRERMMFGIAGNDTGDCQRRGDVRVIEGSECSCLALEGPTRRQSVRSATVGGILVARRAGRTLAIIATSSS